MHSLQFIIELFLFTTVQQITENTDLELLKGLKDIANEATADFTLIVHL